MKCIPKLCWLHYQNPRQRVVFWGTRRLPALLLWSGLLPWFLTQQLWNANNVQANSESVTFPLKGYNFSAVFSFNTTYNFQELGDKRVRAFSVSLILRLPNNQSQRSCHNIYHIMPCSVKPCHVIFNNYSSRTNGLRVNNPWGRTPNGLLTQRPWGREE